MIKTAIRTIAPAIVVSWQKANCISKEESHQGILMDPSSKAALDGRNRPIGCTDGPK